MKPDAFNKQIQQGEIPPVCLLYGEEAFLIQETLDLIRKILLHGEDASMAEEVFHGSESDGSSILVSARTIPLFGGRKLVVVKRVDQMSDPKKEPLLDYIKNPVPETTLVLTAEKPDMRKRFFAQLQKKWPSVRYYHPYDERQAEKWIQSYLKQRGCRIEPQGARLLCEAHGRELQVLKNELEKLILYKGEKGEISLSEAAEVSGQSREYNPFELADTVADRDLERSLHILSRLIHDGIPSLFILSALTAKLRRLRAGKELEECGYTDKELLSSLKISFQGVRFLRQLKGFRGEELEGFYPLLLTIDEAIKTGKARPEFRIEEVIHRICSGRVMHRQRVDLPYA
jgi:DNA polymerase-3 subunit delta